MAATSDFLSSTDHHHQCPLCLLPIFGSTASNKCCLLENCPHVFCPCYLARRRSEPSGRLCPVCGVDSLRVIVITTNRQDILSEHPDKRKALFRAHPRATSFSSAFSIATPTLPTPFKSHMYPQTEVDAVPPRPDTLARFQCPRLTVRGDCDLVRLPALCPFHHRPLGPTIDVDYCAEFLLQVEGGCGNPRYLFDGHVYCEAVNRDGLYRVHLSELELQSWLAVEEASNIFYA